MKKIFITLVALATCATSFPAFAEEASLLEMAQQRVYTATINLRVAQIAVEQAQRRVLTSPDDSISQRKLVAAKLAKATASAMLQIEKDQLLVAIDTL